MRDRQRTRVRQIRAACCRPCWCRGGDGRRERCERYRLNEQSAGHWPHLVAAPARKEGTNHHHHASLELALQRVTWGAASPSNHPIPHDQMAVLATVKIMARHWFSPSTNRYMNSQRSVAAPRRTWPVSAMYLYRPSLGAAAPSKPRRARAICAGSVENVTSTSPRAVSWLRYHPL